MGVTYKAFDVDLRCPVTLKVISERYVGNESARLRFLREARATNCGAKRCRPRLLVPGGWHVKEGQDGAARLIELPGMAYPQFAQ